MKRITFKLLTLMLVCLMLLPLVIACGEENDTTTTTTEEKKPTEEEKFSALSEEEKAFYILELDEPQEERTNSVAILRLQNGSYGNYDVDSSITIKTVNIDTEEKYFDYVETVVITDVRSSTSISPARTEVIVKTGWKDGKCFQYSEVTSNNQTRVSKTSKLQTKEEYIAEKEELENEANQSVSLEFSENFGITRDSCSTVTCVQAEGGEWKATFTDVNEECLAEFKKIIEAFKDYVDIDKVTDVVVELTVTKDLKPVSVNILFGETVTHKDYMRMVVEYSTGDDVVEPEIDLSDYPIGY